MTDVTPKQKNTHTPKMNECPLKRELFLKRTFIDFVFQSSILRGYVSFQGGNFSKSITLEVVFSQSITWMIG